MLPVPDGEQAKTAAVAADCWDALGAAGFTRSDAVVTRRRRRDHRPGRVRRRHLAARGAGRARADHAARHGRRRRRRQDRHQHRRRQEPGRLLPRAGRRGLRPRPAATRCRGADFVAGLGEVVKCGFIADPAILDLVEATDARRRSTAGVAGAARARRARDPGQDRRGGRRPQGDRRRRRATPVARSSTTATPWRTRSSGPSRYAVRHGEAVAIGCVYVAELARLASGLAAEVVDRHRTRARAGRACRPATTAPTSRPSTPR